MHVMVTTLIEQPIVSGKNGVDTAPPLPLRLGNDGPLWMGNKPARQSRPPLPPPWLASCYRLRALQSHH